MQKTATQQFNETAEAAYRAFPRQLARLVIFLTPTSDRPVYVSPQIVGQLTRDTAKIRRALEKEAREMQDKNWVGLACRNFNLAGTPVNLILLDKERGSYSARYTREMALIFTFDHEIGHHILRNGSPIYGVSGQQAESAADAFAMLRHIQRFGKNTDARYAELNNYAIVINADSEHYTTDAVQRAIRISEERDISGLSLRETAALAEKIAGECRIADATLDKILGAFTSVAEASKKAGGWTGPCLREAVKAMRKHKKDPDILKAGKGLLNSPGTKSFITKAARTSSYWKKVLKFLETPGMKPPRYGLLRRLGLRS